MSTPMKARGLCRRSGIPNRPVQAIAYKCENVISIAVLFKQDLHNDLGNCNGFLQSLHLKAWIAPEIIHGSLLQNYHSPSLLLLSYRDLILLMQSEQSYRTILKMIARVNHSIANKKILKLGRPKGEDETQCFTLNAMSIYLPSVEEEVKPFSSLGVTKGTFPSNSQRLIVYCSLYQPHKTRFPDRNNQSQQEQKPCQGQSRGT